MTDEVDQDGIPIVAVPARASVGRRKAIIEAAREEFLKVGYAAASMDAITARSKVSKPTLYSHFGNKERLFLAVIGGALRDAYAELGTPPCEMSRSPDLRAALSGYLGRWARALLDEDLLRLRRLVIGEIGRFPELGRLWFQITDDQLNRPLEDELAKLHVKGRLHVPDAPLAARQLIAMAIGAPQLVRTMLPERAFDERELTPVVTSAVEVFLSHYGPSS
ncbi:TetR/AcrR family transcriptional regulator [Nonomuraea montanisoli]|nr:TetR/AcrR family transcriptional regulator [Nonomuraea montanisoli]